MKKLWRQCSIYSSFIKNEAVQRLSFGTTRHLLCTKEKMTGGICDKGDYEQKLSLVKKHVKAYPDFPSKGILFRDIFSVFNDPEAYGVLLELINTHVNSVGKQFDAVLGLDSRGFLFGPHIALTLRIPFIPIRKKGKLPGIVERLNYSLEYGSDSIEVQKESIVGKKSVLIVDDLLATGGTMKAACDLVKCCGAEVAECFVIMELAGLNGRGKLNSPFRSLITYD